ncbi:MAG: glutathione peroxidase [Nitrosomonadaceae bacterium]|nr:glutathione peroxidase [Nitrosomonadaceae bacterium]|tara:strand:- start:5267 stop:5806 length:540 start_codon:yes stop_codon:yes gene_type:complete
MRTIIFLLLSLISLPTLAGQGALLDYEFRRLASSESINLNKAYKDKVILVVNTASKCGNTPQYEDLEKLYQEYFNEGLVVLGFPSNDFFGQEPGAEKQIQEFCRLTYGVKFPMFEKTKVTKKNAHPFYIALAEAAGTYPVWNFHKYLIGRDGKLINSFSPSTRPYADELISAIRHALKQ